MKWTKERCREEALKYTTKRDFRKHSPSCCSKVRTKGWTDELCSHMENLIKPNGYWTKEKCYEDAIKYEYRSDFFENSVGYVIARKNGWLDEICSHMKSKGNRIKRCIYAYEFPNNSVYVGLTYDINDRKNRHLNQKRSSVYLHIENTNLSPIIKQLTDYIDIDDAVERENVFVEKYKSEGWVILNKVKTGSIGGNVIKWTKEKCSELALNYDGRWKFGKANGSAYNSARKNGWLDEICSHMK